MTHAYRPLPALAATDFWLLSHHEKYQHLPGSQGLVAIGLAAAMLTELLLEDRIGFGKRGPAIAVTEFPPRDTLTNQILDQPHGEERRRVPGVAIGWWIGRGGSPSCAGRVDAGGARFLPCGGGCGRAAGR